jgi:hypothetical protein
VRVTPGIRGTTNLIQIDALIEVRAASAVGTVTLSTNMHSPGSRYYYSQGESINITVVLRVNHTAANASGVLPIPTTVPVQIIADNNESEVRCAVCAPRQHHCVAPAHTQTADARTRPPTLPQRHYANALFTSPLLRACLTRTTTV